MTNEQVLIRLYEKLHKETYNQFCETFKNLDSKNSMLAKALYIGMSQLLLQPLKTPISEATQQAILPYFKSFEQEIIKTIKTLAINCVTTKHLVIQNLNMIKELKPTQFNAEQFHQDLWSEIPDHILEKEKDMVVNLENWTKIRHGDK